MKTSFSRALPLALVAALALAFAGCNKTSVAVKAPVSEKPKVLAFTFTQEKSTSAPVEGLDEIDRELGPYLDEVLFKDNHLTRGPNIDVHYKVTEFDPGSKAARMLVGFGAGAAHTTTNFVFTDEAGKKITEVDIVSKLATQGLVQGKTANLIAKDTAKQLVNFINKNLK